MSKENILAPFIQRPFRHTEIVEKDNALLAMEEYANEILYSVNEGWISTKEQNPPDYERVNYFDSRDKTQHIGFFVWSQTPIDYVTHWKPLSPNPITKIK